MRDIVREATADLIQQCLEILTFLCLSVNEVAIIFSPGLFCGKYRKQSLFLTMNIPHSCFKHIEFTLHRLSFLKLCGYLSAKQNDSGLNKQMLKCRLSLQTNSFCYLSRASSRAAQTRRHKHQYQVPHSSTCRILGRMNVTSVSGLSNGLLLKTDANLISPFLLLVWISVVYIYQAP